MKKYNICYSFTFMLCVFVITNLNISFAQNSNVIIETDLNENLKNDQNLNLNTIPVPNYNQFNLEKRIQKNTEVIMREVEQHQRKMYPDMYRDIDEYLSSAIRYELPSFKNHSGTEHYRKAFYQLEKISNSKNPSLKDAVYVVENAFFENSLSYEKYSEIIRQMISLSSSKIKDENGNMNDDLTKNLMLFRLMSDTLDFFDSQSEQVKHTYPMGYDFEDYEGKKDYSKMFVTKLMISKTGQCHSLPLLFLILSQEIGSEAYLSYAPSHSFVKIKDRNNKWYNLELTNGVFISDAAILESGFIKSEAIKNKIYLDTLGVDKVMSQCYIDLAQGYKFKYGYDEFVTSCIEKSLEYFPNNIFALQMKADYLTLQAAYVARQYGKEGLERLKQDSLAVDLFNKRNTMYKTIDEIGFEPMPSEKYEAWLRSLNDEKIKREHSQQVVKLNQLKEL